MHQKSCWVWFTWVKYFRGFWLFIWSIFKLNSFSYLMSSRQGFWPSMLIHVLPFSSAGPHQRVTWIINTRHPLQFVLYIYKQTGYPRLLNTISYKHWTWLSYTNYSRCDHTYGDSTTCPKLYRMLETHTWICYSPRSIELFNLHCKIFIVKFTKYLDSFGTTTFGKFCIPICIFSQNRTHS